MTIRILLHHVAAECLLFEGKTEQCPPMPRAGDMVKVKDVYVRVEGVEFEFSANCTTVHVLA